MSEPRLVGAFGADKEADDEIRALFETPAVMSTVGGKAGVTVTSLKVLSYKTQVVSVASHNCWHGVATIADNPPSLLGRFALLFPYRLLGLTTR
jgi:hypothetical protein